MAGVRSQLVSWPARSLYWSLAPCVVFFCMLEVKQWHKIWKPLSWTISPSPPPAQMDHVTSSVTAEAFVKTQCDPGKYNTNPHETCCTCVLQPRLVKPKKWNIYNVCFNSGNTIFVFKCGLLCPFWCFLNVYVYCMRLLVQAFHAWSNGQRQRLDYGCFGFIGHWLGTGLVGHCQGLLGPFKYNASTNWKYKLKHNTQRTIQFVRKITKKMIGC